MAQTKNALASKHINGRKMFVVEGDNDLERGDRVAIREEDGTVTLATVTSKDAFSFAVSRKVRDGK